MFANNRLKWLNSLNSVIYSPTHCSEPSRRYSAERKGRIYEEYSGHLQLKVNGNWGYEAPKLYICIKIIKCGKNTDLNWSNWVTSNDSTVQALGHPATDEGPFKVFTAAVGSRSHRSIWSEALSVITNTAFDCHMSIKHHRHKASANRCSSTHKNWQHRGVKEFN